MPKNVVDANNFINGTCDMTKKEFEEGMFLFPARSWLGQARVAGWNTLPFLLMSISTHFWLFSPPVNLSGYYLQVVARSLHTCSCNLVSPRCWLACSLHGVGWSGDNSLATSVGSQEAEPVRWHREEGNCFSRCLNLSTQGRFAYIYQEIIATLLT